jgi:hypothetical protein
VQRSKFQPVFLSKPKVNTQTMKIMQSNQYVWMIALLLLSLYSCDENSINPCERGEGAIVSEVRNVSNFTRISLDIPGDLYIRRDSVFHLEISAQANILDEITTEVIGDRLEIDNDRCLRNHKTIRIDLSLPEVTTLEVNGSGDVFGLDRFETDALNLLVDGSGSIEWEADVRRLDIDIDGSGNITLHAQADEIETDIKGSGDLFLSGSTFSHLIDINGSGDVFAFDAPTNESTVEITGSGGCELRVSDALDVTIRGSGDVKYKGNPQVSANVTGSGRLINDN